MIQTVRVACGDHIVSLPVGTKEEALAAGMTLALYRKVLAKFMEGMLKKKTYGRFLCWAAEDADLPIEQKLAFKLHVTFLLEECDTLTGYLVWSTNLPEQLVDANAQNLRVQWMGALIKVLSDEPGGKFSGELEERA